MAPQGLQEARHTPIALEQCHDPAALTPATSQEGLRRRPCRGRDRGLGSKQTLRKRPVHKEPEASVSNDEGERLLSSAWHMREGLVEMGTL